MGFFDLMIIPHFDQNLGNEICDGTFNPLLDFFFSDSMAHTFLALENGSYIILDDKNTEIYGNAYIIKHGKVNKICSTNKSISIDRNKI